MARIGKEQETITVTPEPVPEREPATAPERAPAAPDTPREPVPA